jgi:hypothetical protein
MKNLEQLFGNIPSKYQIYPNQEFEIIDEAKYLLAIYNSGDASQIQSKLWKKEELTKLEELFFIKFSSHLQIFPTADNKTIFRYEINSTFDDFKSTLKELNERKKSNISFKNLAFWSFSENENWNSTENFKWNIKTKLFSNAKRAYVFYGEQGQYEKEIIFLPNTEFYIDLINENEIFLIEK